MTIPGYDPADLDRALERRLDAPDRRALLTEEQQARYEDGESLLELLDGETISQVLGLSESAP